MSARYRTSAPAAVVVLGSAVFAVVGLGACGSKSGGDVVRALLCGSGHSKGLLTAGVNLEPLKKLGLNTSNAGLRTEINKLITKAGIENLINVKKVESVDKDSEDTSDNGEQFRFLELGGELGGLGVATGLLKQALDAGGFSLAGETTATSFFSSVRESFQMSIATSVLNARDEEFQRIFSPHLALSPSYQPAPQQWAYSQVDNYPAVVARLVANAKKEVVVAVVDTGVDLEHPDLKPILLPGKSFVDSSAGQDGNGHGTHCAGIIASQGVSGGPVGVAASLAQKGFIKILPVKVLGDNGSGSSQAVEKGVRWAVANGAQVISMSLGGGRDYEDARKEGLVDKIIEEAIKAKVIVVVAAGNESCPLGGGCKGQGLFAGSFREYIVHPCSYEGTICVGATNSDETLAPYSNYSSKKTGVAYRTKVDVNAPGTNIYSTWPVALSKGSPYKAISGTSMATPYVAGLAALVKANNPDATQEDVMKILKESQVYPDEIRNKSEEGRVDMLALANKVTGVTEGTPVPRKVVDPNKGKEGEKPLGLVSLWQAVCAAR